MQYKMTKQYARDMETPLAEFGNLSDAELFINTKSALDKSKYLKLIYRLYENDNLLREYNKETMNAPFARAQYAQSDLDLPRNFAGPFSILNQNNVNNADAIIAKFCNIDDAKIFIEVQITTNNASEKISGAYFIFKDAQLIEKIDRNSIDSQQSSSSQETQEQQKKSAFRPTPLTTSLRLGPSKWTANEEDDKDRKSVV